jgi:hypothetical protein
MPMKTLSKPMKTRRWPELARLGDASGTKARVGVANTGRAREGTIMDREVVVDGDVEGGETSGDQE